AGNLTDRRGPIEAIADAHGSGMAVVAFVFVAAAGALAGVAGTIRQSGPVFAALGSGVAAIVFAEMGAEASAYWVAVVATCTFGALLQLFRRQVFNPGRRHLVRFGVAAAVGVTASAVALVLL